MEISKKQDSFYWKKIVAMLAAGWIVIWIYRVALTPVYGIISEYFGGASQSQLGLISSNYFLGYVLMQIPSGLLVDRLGKRAVIVPGFLLFGIGSLIVGLSTSLGQVYFGSILAGLGCGTFYGVAYSLTGEYVPVEKKSIATAIVNSGTAVGSGLGLVGSSYFIGKGILPWQSALWLVTILVLVMVYVFYRFVPTKQFNANQPVDKPLDPTKFSLFTKRMVATYLLYFSTLYTYYLIDTWLPNFLETERHFQGTQVGFAASLVFFMGIPGAIFFSSLADKFRDYKIFIIICLEILAAFMLLLTIRTTSNQLMIFGIIAYGFFGKLAVEPIIISWLSQFVPKAQIATTYGVFNFFGMCSSVIVPSLTGYISDRTGSKIGAFYLAIAIIFIGTVIFYFVNRKEVSKG